MYPNPRYTSTHPNIGSSISSCNFSFLHVQSRTVTLAVPSGRDGAHACGRGRRIKAVKKITSGMGTSILCEEGCCLKFTFQHQPETPENGEQSASDLNNHSGSTNAFGITLQDGSSGPASLAKVQVGYRVQGAEVMRRSIFVRNYLIQSVFQQQSEFPGVQAMFSVPETIPYNLESGRNEEVDLSS